MKMKMFSRECCPFVALFPSHSSWSKLLRLPQLKNELDARHGCPNPRTFEYYCRAMQLAVRVTSFRLSSYVVSFSSASAWL